MNYCRGEAKRYRMAWGAHEDSKHGGATMSEMKRGWMTFNWARLGESPVFLGNNWYGHVVHSPDDGGYYGEAEILMTDNTDYIETAIFPTAQEAGDDMVAQVRATFAVVR